MSMLFLTSGERHCTRRLPTEVEKGLTCCNFFVYFSEGADVNAKESNGLSVL